VPDILTIGIPSRDDLLVIFAWKALECFYQSCDKISEVDGILWSKGVRCLKYSKT